MIVLSLYIYLFTYFTSDLFIRSVTITYVFTPLHIHLTPYYSNILNLKSFYLIIKILWNLNFYTLSF